MTPVLGALLALLTALSVLGTGASPAWAQTSAKFGAGYVELIEDNLKTLCPDSSGGSAGADEDETSGGEQADPDLGESDCGLGNKKFDEAVEKCYAEEDKAKDADDLDKDEFLECMAKEGFGEEEEEETTPEETGVPDQSLARLSASLTAFYVNSLAPKAGGPETDSEESETATDSELVGLDAWESVMREPGNAGSFMGSPDRNKQESSNWLFSASDSNNVSSANYAAFGTQLSGQATDQDSSRADAGVEGYLLYGAMLNGLGFDSTGSTDDVAGLGNQFSGLIMLFAYFGAGSVDAIFDAVVGVLQWTNPFRLMVDALTAETNPEFTQGMRDGPEPPNGALDGLKEFFADIYGIMVDIGWMVTIPLFLATTFAGMLLLRRFETSDKVKQLIIRIAFLVVGVPLLGVSYTAGLAAMEGASGNAANAHATKVVLSTYVDFEGWLNSSRLAPPTGAMSGASGNGLGEFWWNVDNEAPNGPTAASARSLALNINSDIATRPWSAYSGSTMERGGDKHWGESMVTTGDDGAGSTEANPTDVFGATVDLLNRFRSGDKVAAGDFESSIKAGLNTLKNSKPASEAMIYSWTQDYISPEKLASMSESDVKKMRNPLIEVAPGASFTAKRAGGQPVVHFSAQGGARAGCTNDRTVTGNWNPEDPDSDPRSNCNMSPVATFNYLNTSFGSTGMKVYVPSASTSDWSRNAHASVSSVGTGPAKFMYWFSAMSMLVSFTIIGIAYAIMMMVSSLKRTVQLIGSVPFATMGFMGAIAKVIIYTAALFLELFGTIFIYKVVQELIVAIPSIFERPLAEAFANNQNLTGDQVAGAAGAAVGALGMMGEGNMGTLVLVITAVSSIGLILFTAMALKIRRSILDGLDEAVSSLVNKFMGTQASAGMSPGQPGAMRQGVARGAGMAVPAMVMSGGLGGGGEAEMAGVDGGGGGGDGSGPDGGGDGNPGAPGAGDGSMQVAEGGGLTDAAGNPVVGGGGTQLTAMDMVPVDAYGNLAGGDGGAVLGADGSPLAAGDVAGFDGQGRLLDDNGEVLKDAAGNDLMSNPAAAAAGKLAGDKAVAAQALQRGLSGPGEGTRSLGGAQSTVTAATAQSQGGGGGGASSSVPTERVPGEVGGLDRAKQLGVMGVASAAVNRAVMGRTKTRSEHTAAPTSRGGGAGGGASAGGGPAPAAPIPRPPK